MKSEKTISEFLSNEYKEFAMYVIESRADTFTCRWIKTSTP